MKSIFILFFILIFLAGYVSAVNLNTDFTFNTSSSNSSMTFGRSTTADSITITPDNLYLINYFDFKTVFCNVNHTNGSTIDSLTYPCPNPPASGSGGSSKITAGNLGISLNSTLCELTYEPAKTLDYSIITDMIEEHNLTVPWTEVRLYIDNWQSICSDLLNLSLMENLVCSEVGSFLNTNLAADKTAVNNFRNDLKLNVTLSYELTDFYVENYEARCLDIKPSQITPKAKTIGAFGFLILFLFFIFLFYYQRKKKMVVTLAMKSLAGNFTKNKF